MNDWIDIKTRLPEDNQRVHIVTINGYNWRKGEEGIISYDTANFRKGKIPKKGEPISGEDQHGNNLVPYRWTNGPMNWFGQDVLYWKLVTEPVGLKTNPEWRKRCEMNLQNQRKFEKQFSDKDNTIETDLVIAATELLNA